MALVAHGTRIDGGQMASLASKANSKIALTQMRTLQFNQVTQDFGTPPYAFPDTIPLTNAPAPMWLSELNRLRADLMALLYFQNDDIIRANTPADCLWKYQVSGPWPLNNLANYEFGSSVTSSGAPAFGVDFYFPETGNIEEVKLISKFTFLSYDTRYADATGPRDPPLLQLLVRIKVVGNWIFTGTLSFVVGTSIGLPAAGTVTASSNFPGANFIYDPGNAPLQIPPSFQADFDHVSLPAGDYTIEAVCHPSVGSELQFSEPYIHSLPSGLSLEIYRITPGPGAIVSGIHSTTRIRKISVPNGVEPSPGGFYGTVYKDETSTKLIFYNGFYLEATTPGIYAGKTVPINSLESIFAPSWIRTTLQPENQSPWQAATQVYVNQRIIDSNGNTQISLVYGYTYYDPPNWATTLNAITPELGQAIDPTTGLPSPLVRWRLEKLFSGPVINGARPMPDLKIPRYPYQRVQAGTPTPLSMLIPGGMGNPPQNPQDDLTGRWIVGVNATSYTATAVSVKIGCVRNNAFVEFATMQTGTYTPVFWPVFTQTPLSYVASEAVEVQAWTIGAGCGARTGGNAYYPIAATHYNDLDKILDLLELGCG